MVRFKGAPDDLRFCEFRDLQVVEDEFPVVCVQSSVLVVENNVFASAKFIGLNVRRGIFNCLCLYFHRFCCVLLCSLVDGCDCGNIT